jgi:Cu/Ag efflux protein CusF
MRKTLVIALALLSPAWPSLAQTHAMPAATTAAPASGLPMVNAEVRRVDGGAGKVTLKHDDIPNLEMPAMTMVFQVQDPARLGQLKMGDKVRFTADKINGAYTVIELTAVP